METFTNMSVGFVRVSKGYATVSDMRVYCELWLSVERMNLKVKFKVPKGMSYSYTASAKDAPFEDGQFLSYWIPKNIYFPVHFCGEGVNELVEIVIKHINLKFFNESRKWLSKEEDEAIRLERKNCSLMEWCQDGIQDYPWAIYVGTRSECEAYIRKTVKTTI